MALCCIVFPSYMGWQRIARKALLFVNEMLNSKIALKSVGPAYSLSVSFYVTESMHTDIKKERHTKPHNEENHLKPRQKQHTSTIPCSSNRTLFIIPNFFHHIFQWWSQITKIGRFWSKARAFFYRLLELNTAKGDVKVKSLFYSLVAHVQLDRVAGKCHCRLWVDNEPKEPAFSCSKASDKLHMKRAEKFPCNATPNAKKKMYPHGRILFPVWIQTCTILFSILPAQLSSRHFSESSSF